MAHLRQWCHLGFKLKIFSAFLILTSLSLPPVILPSTLTHVASKPYEFYFKMLFSFVFTSLFPLSLLFSRWVLLFINFSNFLLSFLPSMSPLLQFTFYIVVKEGKEGKEKEKEREKENFIHVLPLHKKLFWLPACRKKCNFLGLLQITFHIL